MPVRSRSAPLAGSERLRPATHTLVGPVGASEEIGIQLLVRPRTGSSDFGCSHMATDAHRQAQLPHAGRIYEDLRGSPDGPRRDCGICRGAWPHGNRQPRRQTRSERKGTASRLNATFGITLNYYEGPPGAAPAPPGDVVALTQRHHGYDGPVHLPPELAGIVLAVIGLDNRCLERSGNAKR